MSTPLHGACRGPRPGSGREPLPQWPWLPRAETSSAIQRPSSQLTAPHTEARTAFLLLSPQHTESGPSPVPEPSLPSCVHGRASWGPDPGCHLQVNHWMLHVPMLVGLKYGLQDILDQRDGALCGHSPTWAPSKHQRQPEPCRATHSPGGSCPCGGSQTGCGGVGTAQ